MELTMMMPANYAVLDTEEMTYVDGGVTTTQAICALFVPFYGWYKGVKAIKAYSSGRSDWLESGLDALTSHMEKSTNNLLYDIGCIWQTVAVTAAFPVGTIATAVLYLL